MAIPDFAGNEELSEQLLKELMKTGYYSFLEQAEQIVEDKSAELDLQEADNRVQRRAACRQFPSAKILPCGCLHFVTNLCGDYRLCDNCREKYFKDDIEPRLRYAHNHLPLGTWLKWVSVRDNDEEAYKKAILRHGGQYMRFPQGNRVSVIVHNAVDFGDRDLFDFDEYEGMDVNFKEVIANTPERKRISGKLGQKAFIEEEEEGNSEEEEKDEFEPVRIPFLRSPDSTKRDLNLAYMKAVGKTQDINVDSQYSLSQAMFLRLEEMKELLPENAYIYYEIRAIGQKQAELWNDNPNNGVVQIGRIEESYTYYLDKDVNPGLVAFLKEAEKAEPTYRKRRSAGI